MERLHELQLPSKRASSERFAAVLPRFLNLLEGEWRLRYPVMNTEEEMLFRQAHAALGGIQEMTRDGDQ